MPSRLHALIAQARHRPTQAPKVMEPGQAARGSSCVKQRHWPSTKKSQARDLPVIHDTLDLAHVFSVQQFAPCDADHVMQKLSFSLFMDDGMDQPAAAHGCALASTWCKTIGVVLCLALRIEQARAEDLKLSTRLVKPHKFDIGSPPSPHPSLLWKLQRRAVGVGRRTPAVL